MKIAIVSKPQNAVALLSMLHTCVDHIERIIEYHSPSTTTKIAPPLPPKPTHVSKPVLPPKPTSKLPPIPTPSKTTTLTMKRSVSNRGKRKKKLIFVMFDTINNILIRKTYPILSK